MNSQEFYQVGIFTFFAIIPVLCLLFRHRKWIYSWVYWAIVGILTLVTIHYTSPFTGIALLINATTLTIATTLGIPGVISLLLMQMIW